MMEWKVSFSEVREAQLSRPDEHIDINPTRSHLATGLRNFFMGLCSPFSPTQGALWTGIHVLVVQRWKEGGESDRCLHDGISYFALMGLSVIYFILPLLSGIKPLSGVALSLTLILTGLACAYVAMEMTKNSAERGTSYLVSGCQWREFQKFG